MHRRRSDTRGHTAPEPMNSLLYIAVRTQRAVYRGVSFAFHLPHTRCLSLPFSRASRLSRRVVLLPGGGSSGGPGRSAPRAGTSGARTGKSGGRNKRRTSSVPRNPAPPSPSPSTTRTLPSKRARPLVRALDDGHGGARGARVLVPAARGLGRRHGPIARGGGAGRRPGGVLAVRGLARGGGARGRRRGIFGHAPAAAALHRAEAVGRGAAGRRVSAVDRSDVSAGAAVGERCTVEHEVPARRHWIVVGYLR